MKANDPERIGEVEINGEKRTYLRGKTAKEYTPWVKDIKGDEVYGGPMTDYINRADTRKAMNIPASVGVFKLCRDHTEFEYNISSEGSVYFYDILRKNIKILVYSGDTDASVNTYGTRRWIKGLKWPITKEWTLWYVDS